MYKISYSYNSAGCVPDSDSNVGNLLEFETLESLKDYMVDIIKFQFDDFDADEDYTEYLDALYAEIRKAESLQELPTFFDQNKGEYDLYSLEFEIEEILPPCVGDTLPVSDLSDCIYDIVNGGDVPDVTIIRDFLGRDYKLLYRHYFVKSVNGCYAEIWGSDSLDENAGADCLYIAESPKPDFSLMWQGLLQFIEYHVTGDAYHYENFLSWYFYPSDNFLNCMQISEDGNFMRIVINGGEKVVTLYRDYYHFLYKPYDHNKPSSNDLLYIFE